ncbi:MAG TPA: TonB-dependent receptor [Acidobacteriaceae bacterium]|jgi:iron complex outermembrane receptor protein/vitamin B12 transporter|nr:TonB-dependent receptor [Acidobacteriaceae bacterium]
MTFFSRPARRSLPAFLLCVFLLGSGTALHAVSVHGTVTDPLGYPIANAVVGLVHDGKVLIDGRTAPDGTYTLVISASGRFYVLATGHSFRQLATQSFYAGQLDNVTQNIVLEPEWVRQSVVVTATGEPQPQAQVSASVTGLSATQFENDALLVDSLRAVPGVNVVQTGERGGETSLFIRGGSSTANRVLLDGVPIEDVGGRFDFGNQATTGLASVEVYRGPNSVLYGSDAAAGVVALTTPRGSTSFPSLLYDGDAGNFKGYRNQVQLGGMKRKLDYYGGYSNLQMQNSIPGEGYHNDTEAANLGWSWSAKTQARVTGRNTNSATGVPSGNSGYSFYGLANDGKELDQDTYMSATIDHTIRDAWKATVRYGLIRKREESQQWYPAGNLLAGNFVEAGNYFGNNVTVPGANGTSTTGQALLNFGTAFGSVYPWKLDLASNRDSLYAETNYQHGPHLGVIGAFRYEDERGLEAEPAYAFRQGLERENYDYQAQVGGQFRNRLFYTAAGGVEQNGLFGLVGTPHAGVSWYVVRPGQGIFHGTKVKFNFARGYQEPTLDQQNGSLYSFLVANGGQATAAQYGIVPIGEEQSRSYDGGLEQSLFNEKVIARVTYFHNEFGNQIEPVPATLVPQLLPALSPAQQQQLEGFLTNNYAYELDLNSLAWRAIGIESELEYGLGRNLYLRGGYTYLDSGVQHSFSSDAVGPSYNPNYPGVPIGNYAPLAGARPFRQPPHTGFTSVIYTGRKWTAVVNAAYASRSDDSTYLGGLDVNGGNTLLLPNRNLDYAYTKIDLGGSYQIRPWSAVYTQLDNLSSNQHIGPIGYPSLPFTFRTGLRFTLKLGPR